MLLSTLLLGLLWPALGPQVAMAYSTCLPSGTEEAINRALRAGEYTTGT